MVKDHRKDLTEFKREASTGKDPQVKTAAAQGAQVIQQHVEMAEQVAQKVGANTSKTSPSHMAKPGASSTSVPQQ